MRTQDRRNLGTKKHLTEALMEPMISSSSGTVYLCIFHFGGASRSRREPKSIGSEHTPSYDHLEPLVLHEGFHYKRKSGRSRTYTYLLLDAQHTCAPQLLSVLVISSGSFLSASEQQTLPPTTRCIRPWNVPRMH
jgi:hypothetical protein